MRITITGGAGSLGEYLAERLSDDHDVCVFDNQDYDGVCRSIKGDVREYQDLRGFLEGSDVVVHAAAVTDVKKSENRPIECFDVNVKGTYNVCKSILKMENECRLIFLSSREVYGPNNEANEEDSLQPSNVYGRSKVMGESLVKNMVEEAVIFRLTNIFGIEGGLVSNLRDKILAGENISLYSGVSLDLIDVYDVFTILSQSIAGEGRNTVYNVGSGQQFSLDEVIEVIESELSKDAKITWKNPPPFITKEFGCDIERLKRDFDIDVTGQREKMKNRL